MWREAAAVEHHLWDSESRLFLNLSTSDSWQKQTSKQPVDSHIDIIPTFHGHEENTHNRGGTVFSCATCYFISLPLAFSLLLLKANFMWEDEAGRSHAATAMLPVWKQKYVSCSRSATQLSCSTQSGSVLHELYYYFTNVASSKTVLFSCTNKRRGAY